MKFPEFSRPSKLSFPDNYKVKPNVTNHLSSQFGSLPAELQNISFKGRIMVTGSIHSSHCVNPTNFCYCYWQLCIQLDAQEIDCVMKKQDLINSPSNFKFPEFSRINKFAEISMFSRVVSTLSILSFSHIFQYNVCKQGETFHTMWNSLTICGTPAHVKCYSYHACTTKYRYGCKYAANSKQF